MTVNSQITDSVATTTTLLVGQSAATAMGILDLMMAETLGMAMQNAVARQQNNQITSTAAISATCARLLQTAPPRPPSVVPLQPIVPPPLGGLPSPPDPASAIARSFAHAESAVEALQREHVAAADNARAAERDLLTVAGRAADAALHPPTIP
jgi:hypothetical protein